MLSSKWTFSLTSLVIILVLAFVVPSAMAAEFGVSLSISDANDVSYEDGYQIERNPVVEGLRTTILVKTDKVVNYLPNDAADDILSTGLQYKHFIAIAYNKFGGATVIENTQGFGTESGAQGTIPLFGRPPDGKNFQFDFFLPRNAADDIVRIHIFLEKHKFEIADPRADLNDDGTRKADGKNAAASIDFYYVSDNIGPPTVFFMKRPGEFSLPVTAETFDVVVQLSEEPKKDTFTKDRFDISNADITKITALGAFDGDRDSGFIATGRTIKVYKYLLTVAPKYENKNDIVIKIKDFESQEKHVEKKYTAPATDAARTEGVDKLTIKVGKEVLKAGTAGLEVILAKELFIPSGGYLVVADDEAGSAITNPGGAKDAPPVTRPPAAQKYNLNAKALPNLETFLANGGVIDVVSPMSLTISEIMWGSDASIEADNSKSQWIELQNSGAGANTLDDDAATAADEATRLIFYGYGQAPAATLNADGTTTLPAGVKDRVGTIDAKGAVWSLAGKGQSGRTGAGEEALQLAAVVPTQPIISMYRVAGADDGTLAASWMASSPPAVNFKLDAVGVRIASPGAAPIVTVAAQAAADAAAKAKADAAAAAAAKAADTSVSMPKVGQIYISEVMFAGGGSLPQWIEISNGSRTEQVNLSGWTLTVENATADADVSVGAKAVFTIPEGTRIDPSGQHDTTSTILVVTEQGRHNLDAGPGTMGEDQILNLWTAQQTELILLGVTKRRYSLLSDMAFQITLAPPVPIVAPAAATPAPTTAAGIAAARAAAAAKKAADATAALVRKAATDVVGNLGTAGTATWALPMDEGARSSIIRRHVPVSIGAAAPEAGEMMDSWALASDTSFAQITHIRASSYYGSADDVGTPGFRAGGALPVELSHFRPARDKVTDAVVITWATQSELNNAGFFIKRSQQRDGEFQIINAAMIQGAGTSSEKQFYTYTDTTAQPNVVYYYQIEDVSLDGNRQTLTNGIRLKGHVGAAGKLTTMWGDLKTQE